MKYPSTSLPFDQWLVASYDFWAAGNYAYDDWDEDDQPPRTIGNHLWGLAQGSVTKRYIDEHPDKDPRLDDRYTSHFLTWVRKHWLP